MTTKELREEANHVGDLLTAGHIEILHEGKWIKAVPVFETDVDDDFFHVCIKDDREIGVEVIPPVSAPDGKHWDDIPFCKYRIVEQAGEQT